MNAKHPDRLFKMDRLTYIVNRMRLKQDITPAMLADELHVSERTIYRDLRNLDKGNALKKRYSRREGRYMLESGTELPPLSLTAAETVALFMAASNPALSRNNFYADDLRSGLAKLVLALDPSAEQEDSAEPPAFLAGYAVVGSPLTITPDSVQRPTREIIQRAMNSNRKLRFHYWSRNNEHAIETVVAPYDLRPVRNDWYLLAQAERGVEARIYKVSRMRRVEILPDRFRLPRHFSVDHSFARALKAADEIDAEILIKARFSAAVASVVLESHAQRLTDVHTKQDGSIVCTLPVYDIREILWWILSYGADAEVLEPHNLRMQCAHIAQSMVKLYANPPVVES